MKLVSTTLAGPSSPGNLADALESVLPVVDECIVILSGGGDAAASVARRLCEEFGKPLRVVRYHWRDDYGQARQFALEVAIQFGFDWAVTLDDDERIEWMGMKPGIDVGAKLVRNQLNAILTDTELDVLVMQDRDVDYSKARIIRCTDRIQWVGRYHEQLSGARVPFGLMPGVFWELPKTDAQKRKVFERAVAWLTEEPQWLEQHHFRRHYADCLIGLGRYVEASAELEALEAIEHELTPDEAGFIQYRLAELEVVQGQLDQGFARAGMGAARFPQRIQEFGWLLAHVNAVWGNGKAAALWAEYALGLPVDPFVMGQRSPSWRIGCEELLQRIHAENAKAAAE